MDSLVGHPDITVNDTICGYRKVNKVYASEINTRISSQKYMVRDEYGYENSLMIRNLRNSTELTEGKNLMPKIRAQVFSRESNVKNLQ